MKRRPNSRIISLALLATGLLQPARGVDLAIIPGAAEPEEKQHSTLLLRHALAFVVRESEDAVNTMEISS
jgi:hypothetical protein